VLPLLEQRDANFLAAAVAAITLPDVPLRPLHGDAHLQNVLQTGDGPIWIDLEGPRAGPIEWDLAALQHRALAWGEMRDEIAAAIRGYGRHDRDLADELAGPVGVWLAAMSCLIAQSLPESRPRADARLAFVRHRLRLRWVDVG
jgi:Ser/Thr protein kinase RdoA (MazF antagonist)